MRLLKTQFARFFALGFAGGAVLVFGVMGIDTGTSLSDSMVPPAEAATTR
ncbi:MULTISPECIES: hypothetical protein [Novosphingobium]|uniref:Uncharacterized protein n=3 Tax=Novosphingobium TaxID=165696 RepID=A0ABT0AAK7_9SPHN|nr:MULTISPECIES: hypothetical protein [Novosphingobium]MCJ1960234.1 hypothetical protein [Novosphingobium mangrovi (ex Hu et al. 2023)]MED5544938.1 hypothetical protein [Pseudomonadota bacterium]QVM84337.1 hypothetical protein HT578_12125 [Novosphingobium decolorationis]GAM04739.1 hypothetical conserved protein [Novosphingobium sp. MBES04]